jgi:hypothetical protein
MQWQERVIAAWAKGRTAEVKNLWTDGRVLYSDYLRVGDTSMEDFKIVYCFLRDYLGHVSVEVAALVELAIPYSDVIVSDHVLYQRLLLQGDKISFSEKSLRKVVVRPKAYCRIV